MSITLTNNKYTLKIENGVITNFYSDIFSSDTNLAYPDGKSGTVCYTLLSDDITAAPHEVFTPYHSRTSACESTSIINENTAVSVDSTNNFTTEVSLTDTGVTIKGSTQNPNISEFGINFDLNFLSRTNSDVNSQILPTSPYTSSDGKYMFFIMTTPGGNFLVITAKTPCDGWKTDYSSHSFGHSILGLKILASFDKVYGGSGKKSIELNLQAASSLDEAFSIISRQYDTAVCRPILNGGFDDFGIVKVYGQFDYLQIISPSGNISTTDSCEINMSEFGFYTVTPITDGKAGVDCILWNGKNISELFDKSCDAITKPYHPDDNLCEGGCFLWAMLCNMNSNNNYRYDSIAKSELDIITAKSDYVPRKTIVPHATADYGAYHIHNSIRIQEQFFGVSILLEAYKLYKTEELYEYTIATLMDLVENYIKNGMVYNGNDYTTVCAPLIPIVDTYLLLKEKNDKRCDIFKNVADDIARFLYNRQYNFPTEGANDKYEDGSISCTALSILYYCRYVARNTDYERFAYDVLKLHRAWTMYSPDAKINGSSFRWWETIWEGDGEGPALCCGHAWTIWKGEACYHAGILFRDDSLLLDSWNAYVTNFCKTQPDGTMYSCYEADYIRGGGDLETKLSLKQLQGENLDTKYTVAHSFPMHTDNSLSRYVWIRAYSTWLKTAAILNIDGKTIAINAKIENNIIKTNDNITEIYIGNSNLEIENKNLIIL